jgi:hypothetical protein
VGKTRVKPEENETVVFCGSIPADVLWTSLPPGLVSPGMDRQAYLDESRRMVVGSKKKEID